MSRDGTVLGNVSLGGSTIGIDTSTGYVYSTSPLPSSSDAANATWSYDLKSDIWTPVAAGPPGPIVDSAMAYDAASDRIILFGGKQGYDHLHSTWSFDLNSNLWTPRDPREAPSPRSGSGMTYNSESNRLILFGGETSWLSGSSDTWVYDFDNDTWTPMDPPTEPSPRRWSAMTYDSVANRAVLFGGYGDYYGSSGFSLGDTWTYDYDNDMWTQVNPGTAPSPRYSASMVYDSESDRVLLFGGYGDLAQLYDDTWAYDLDNDTWTPMDSPLHPPPLASASAGYDATSDRFVIFGGRTIDAHADYRTQDDVSSETWTYDLDNDSWELRQPFPTPQPRMNAAMAYDEESDRFVLYGGWTAKGLTGVRLNAIDPLSGAMLRGPWNYPFGITGVYGVWNGSLFAAHAWDGTISAISAETGAILRNYSGLSPGELSDIGADPAGRWLFGQEWKIPNGPGIGFRLDLARGTYYVMEGFLESGPGWTFSPDGATVYKCAYAQNFYRFPFVLPLLALWIANMSLRSDGFCISRVVANPVTGILALEHTSMPPFLSTGGPFGETMPLDGSCQPMNGLRWTGDGRALVGRCGEKVLAWSGTPQLAPPVTSLLGPEADLLTFNVTSVSGFNGSTMTVSVDGQPQPFVVSRPIAWTVTINVSVLADGVHTVQVTGWDLLGQWMDATIGFERDLTAPAIRILSPSETTTTPFLVWGAALDRHLARVRVNGNSAALDGTNWSALLDLLIGNNSFRVDASDAVDLRSNILGVLRYWPLHDHVVTNATNRYSVAIPPGWTLNEVALPGGSRMLMLIEPSNGAVGTYFSVAAFGSPFANDSYEGVKQLALYQAQTLSSLGMRIRGSVYPDEVDGHAAASFQATGSAWGYPETSVVTVVASGAWHLAYVLTMSIPDARASANLETRTWILEGFHIAASPPSPGPPEVPEVWPFVGLGITGAVCATGIAWVLWIERRQRRHPQRRTR